MDAFSGYWWVAHTKSRQEKALAAQLDSAGIGCFLPLVRSNRRHGRRFVDVSLPLFPSYLFFSGGDSERYAVLATHRAAGVIAVVDQARFKDELRQVDRVVQSQEAVDLYPGLKRGRRCRVVRGSLAGLEGVVLRYRNRVRIYIGVEALGQSAELEIDPSLLEPIE